MSTLDSLSTDTLQLVTDQIDGRDIGCLWLLGNNRLNARLGSGGGVKSFRLHFTSHFQTQWPSLVRHFASLEHFAISYAVGEAYAKDWEPHYSELRRSLRTVKFAFQSDFQSFFSALSSGHTFPCLEEIVGLDAFRSTPETLPLFVSLLPPTLTSIQFVDNYFYLPPTSWPPQLKKLSATISKFASKFHDASDDIHRKDYPQAKGEEIAMLEDLYRVVYPVGLEELFLRVSQNCIPAVLDAQWPYGLRKLSLFMNNSQIGPEAAALLPRSLTFLDTPIQPLSSEFLMALPQGLLELNLHGHNAVKTEAMARLLPRSLTRLWGLIATENILRGLPPSITAIDHLEINPVLCGLLPIGLRVLGVKGEAYTPFGSFDFWPRLPESLTSASCFNPQYLEHHPLPTNLRKLILDRQTLTAQQAEKFSFSKITYLYISSCLFDIKHLIEHLPKNITRLELKWPNCGAMDSADCKNLPKTLRSLELTDMKFTASNPLSDFPTGLEHLKISLQELNIGCLGSDECFFPKLESLDISLARLPLGFGRYIFSILPRRLKKFGLSYPRTHRIDLTDETLNSLPRGLVLLNLGRVAGVTGSWLSNKPTYLQHFFG